MERQRKKSIVQVMNPELWKFVHVDVVNTHKNACKIFKRKFNTQDDVFKSPKRTFSHKVVPGLNNSVSDLEKQDIFYYFQVALRRVFKWCEEILKHNNIDTNEDTVSKDLHLLFRARAIDVILILSSLYYVEGESIWKIPKGSISLKRENVEALFDIDFKELCEFVRNRCLFQIVEGGKVLDWSGYMQKNSHLLSLAVSLVMFAPQGRQLNHYSEFLHMHLRSEKVLKELVTEEQLGRFLVGTGKLRILSKKVERVFARYANKLDSRLSFHKEIFGVASTDDEYTEALQALAISDPSGRRPSCQSID